MPPAPHWPEDRGAGASGTQADAADALLASHQQAWKRESLEKELAACREELAAMRALLDDLPRIFESKFENRLRPLLEQKERLLHGNEGLREQLRQLQPGGLPIAGSLMPAATHDAEAAVSSPPRQRGWARNLRHAFGVGQPPR
ncbi:hypothetical protein [Cyanobium sp. CH-040]|uniref:hypothetical protein n=1 Tax=Cyanobium sp. CH-040 TaxID=2823708 RepID=UPI0020CDD9A8|nr:hypothetical protein [Cyanobium sp. CH-040]MCP9927070.1 hypothetical protein [Cyanobium sp. CH-040]